MIAEAIPEAAVSDPILFALMRRLADNKYWLGRRYAEWCTAAPTLESAVAAAAMSQDEIGHARSQYPLFRQFVGRDVEPEDLDEFHCMSAFDSPFGGWVDFVATNCLVDTAITTLFEAAQASSYDDLRNRARRIVGEEQVHWLHGSGWVKRLAGDSDGTRDALQQALSRLWPETLMWFGRDSDPDAAELVDRGILNASPSHIRHALLDTVSPLVVECGLAAPPDVESLAWDAWDPIRSRIA